MSREMLLQIEGLRIEGRSGDDWTEIVQGVDLTLCKGEVLGLIGESGAGKSTVGLAAMGYARDGCRITGGTIRFDGIDLLAASKAERRALRGRRIAYVAQSAAASFNPAHRLIDQYAEAPVVHGVMDRARPAPTRSIFTRGCCCPTPRGSAFAIRIRSRAGSCSAR
jgi:peptide/nickel transport system ATP-binding protein